MPLIIYRTLGVLLLFSTFSVISASASKTSNETEEATPIIPEKIGNNSWISLLNECSNDTLECLTNSALDYFESNPVFSDDLYINVTDIITTFVSDVSNYTEIALHPSNQTLNNQDNEDAPVEEDEREEITHLETILQELQNKTLNYLSTHDLEVKLPETFFEGATLKLSPRSLGGDGDVVKMDIIPESTSSQPRILFKKLKKIKHKLIFALLAILIVIKLLITKFIFFLPMIMGAAAAKKLLIKILLFIFPALHNLFKLCPYGHGLKLHHHKHSIAHVHHLKPYNFITHEGPHHHHEVHGGPHDTEIIVPHPHGEGPPVVHTVQGGHPSWHHHADIGVIRDPSYQPHEDMLEYYAGGPGLGHDFLLHRKDNNREEEPGPGIRGQGHHSTRRKKPSNGRLTPTEIEAMILKAEKEALVKARLQKEKKRIEEENKRLQEQLKQAIRLHEKLKQKQAIVKSRITSDVSNFGLIPPAPSKFLDVHSKPPIATKLSPPALPEIKKSPKIPPPPPLAIQKVLGSSSVTSKPQLKTQHKISSQIKQSSHIVKQMMKSTTTSTTVSPEKAFEEALHQAATITYDKFYSPILEKIDKITNNLGFTDEPCRERLICSMYKNPLKFSPHSNLLSAELSRDSKELKKPTQTNAAVIRFYRYVQAARDGQDQRDCLRLYTSCSINTEKLKTP